MKNQNTTTSNEFKSKEKLFIHPEIPELPRIDHDTLSKVQLGLFLSDVLDGQEGITVHSMIDVSHKERRAVIKGKLLEVSMKLPKDSVWSTDKKLVELRARIFIPADHYDYCHFAEHCMGNGKFLS